jgi:hypothetical protein
MKTKDESLRNFYWQDGYGSFGVDPAKTDIVAQYIANQHAHHEKKSYKSEYLAFLHRYNIKYDERYLWD